MYLVKEGPTGGVEAADRGWWASLVLQGTGICWTRKRDEAMRFSTLELATYHAERVGGVVEHEHNGVMSNETR